MTKRRVVITGMGVVSPFGVGADKLWDGVVSGKSAISKIENMGDMTGHTVLIGGEIKESVFNPVDYFEPKEAKRLDKFLQYSIVAAREAVSDLVELTLRFGFEVLSPKTFAIALVSAISPR